MDLELKGLQPQGLCTGSAWCPHSGHCPPTLAKGSAPPYSFWLRQEGLRGPSPEFSLAGAAQALGSRLDHWTSACSQTWPLPFFWGLSPCPGDPVWHLV